ncbi:extracellular solute-binding protein [uncultured Ruminococcus sp.]|uniref:ABC transporter substrate-binding protein n=1 Tax=uncultured Ruminococcus sp. TaxID=165186 RepID=UPI0025CDA0BA|nr:extracellular solute-binding protein [uncultured Ruminococcus sp.]
MKKIISFSAALVIMLSGICATSCGKRTEENNNKENSSISDDISGDELSGVASLGQKVDVSGITGYYTAEKVNMPADVEYIYSVCETDNDELQLMYSVRNPYEKKIYLADRELSVFSFIKRELPEEVISADYYEIMTSDTDTYSNASVIYLIEDHGGLKLPEEHDENYDYDAYYDNCAESYLLVNYSDNKIVSSFTLELPEADGYGSDGINDILEFDDHLLVVYDNRILLRINKADGYVTQIMETEIIHHWYRPLVIMKDCNGETYAIRLNADEFDREHQYLPGEQTGMKYELCKLEGNSLAEPLITIEENEGYPQKGYGKYKFLLNKTDALYGVCGDGSMEEIINWENSNLDLMEVFPLGNDEFLGIKEKATAYGSESEYFKLKPGDVSALAEKSELTLGVVMYDKGVTNEIVKDFNRNNDRYHVRTVVYGDPDEVVDDGYKDNTIEVIDKAFSQLCDDIRNGNGPDIVMGLGYGDYCRLANNEALVDMDQFLDGRNGYTRDDVFPAIIKSMSAKDGKIYGLPGSFYCESLIVKNKFWDKPTWTMDEMLEFYDNAPDSAAHMYDDTKRLYMFADMLASAYGVIDYDKGECHFDSDDFIKRLEFANRFLSDDEGFDSDQYAWFGTDKTLVIKDNVNSQINIVKDLQGSGEEINMVGYPTDDSERGGMINPEFLYCITSSCQDKDGAWEFVSKALTFPYDVFSCFKPETRNILNSEIGVEHTASGIPVPSLTAEQADMLYDYLCKCDNTAVEYDHDMSNTILEEADKYFAGECSAEDAAKSIQSRVSEIMKKYK